MHWAYRVIKRVFHHPVKWACRVNAKGWERVPREGPVILVPNHWTWADPVILGAIVGRPCRFLGKHSLFSKPVLGWLLRSTDQIPVNRATGGNDAAVLAAAAFVRQGKVVGVYPEGTRSDAPGLLPFKSGAVRVALLTGAPIVPVGQLTDRFWPKGKILPRFGRRTYHAFGEPYTLGLDPALADDREFCRKASEDLRAKVEALLEECRAARDRKEKWRYP